MELTVIFHDDEIMLDCQCIDGFLSLPGQGSPAWILSDWYSVEAVYVSVVSTCNSSDVLTHEAS